jgi:hypothetical protein
LYDRFSRLTSDRIQFKVRDYGPGVAKDQLKKIFKLFYRSENELTRETVGTGIGLALAHQMTVSMNGQYAFCVRNDCGSPDIKKPVLSGYCKLRVNQSGKDKALQPCPYPPVFPVLHAD